MIRLSGLALQKGPAVTAPVAVWPVYDEFFTPTVLAAAHLTIEVARRALAEDVCAVVTQHGGFACHGANVLRTRSAPITWLTGVSLDQIPDGTVVCIDDSGQTGIASTHIDALEWKPIHEWMRLQIPSGPSPSGICYWGHRTYDALTASLMIPGLTACATRLAGVPVTVATDSFGHLWFEGALTTHQYKAMLSDPNVASDELALQARVYERLHDSADLLNSSRAIKNAFFEYFSVHLLTHNTYESIFIKLAQRAVGHGATAEEADRMIGQILATPFTAWHRDDPMIRTHKSIYDTTKPAFSPQKPTLMIENHVAAIRTSWRERELRGLWPLGEHACRGAGLKEYKFFANKIIYSAASEWIRNHGPSQLADDNAADVT